MRHNHNHIERLHELQVLPEVRSLLEHAKSVYVPHSRSELMHIIFGSEENDYTEVVFDLPASQKKGTTDASSMPNTPELTDTPEVTGTPNTQVATKKKDDTKHSLHYTPYKEAHISRCKNGIAINFFDTYMRRRDPEATVIADTLATDKRTFQDRFGRSFDPIRSETFTWLKTQDILVLPFYAGGEKYGYLSLAFIPRQAAFFALALYDLQGYADLEQVNVETIPYGYVYVAPPFRHTHFEGKQVVVHRRQQQYHEMFSYNLYPGPSAKKGVYSMLLNLGEHGTPPWSVLHCSTVRTVTPYENEMVIMHEGASGGGKTEMTQEPHLKKGKMHLAINPDTEEGIILDINDTCDLFPVTDDMGIAHNDLQTGRKLTVEDAEKAWFLRVDHLASYGTDPQLEELCIDPPEPLIFLNIDGKPGATALPWDHIMDEPEKPCPNPRVVLPRHYVQNIVEGSVSVDIRSFGVRTPRCTKEHPSYGIFGVLQVLPPSLAWLWRLVAPRGSANPSIVATGAGMKSEGVGSYWPFALGRKVDQANILLNQIQESPETGYILIPNQFIGAYKVGFNAQWITREFISRRNGLRFRSGKLSPARSPLLGFVPTSFVFNSFQLPRWLLRVEEQVEVGKEGFDAGAKELHDFFHQELRPFREMKELNPLGKAIIDVCLDGGTIQDYVSVMPFLSASLGV